MVPVYIFLTARILVIHSIVPEKNKIKYTEIVVALKNEGTISNLG